MDETKDYVLIKPHTISDGTKLAVGDTISLTETQAANMVGKIADSAETVEPAVMPSKSGVIDGVAEEIAIAEAKVPAEAVQKIADLEAKVLQVSQEIPPEKVVELEAQIQTAKEEVPAAATAEITELTNALEVAKAETIATAKLVEAPKDEAEALLRTQLQEAKDKLQAFLATKKEEIAAAKAEIPAEAKVAIEQLESAVVEANKVVPEIAAKEISDLKAEVKKVSKEIPADEVNAITELKQELETAKAEVDKVKAQVEATATELETAKEEVPAVAAEEIATLKATAKKQSTGVTPTKVWNAYKDAVGGLSADGNPLPVFADLPQRQKDGWAIVASLLVNPK
jgi:hypothetical protein